MSTTSDVQMKLNLAFPKAGIVFAIEVGPPGGGSGESGGSFSLAVTDTSGGGNLPFSVDVCPQLADWVRGYSRWLRRANVTASNSEDRITGRSDSGLTPEQVLDGVRGACDMIRQRFDLYQESVLAYFDRT